MSTLLLLQALLCVGGRVPEVAAAGRGQGAVLRGTRQRGTSLLGLRGRSLSLRCVSLCPLFPQTHPIASVQFICVWC